MDMKIWWDDVRERCEYQSVRGCTVSEVGTDGEEELK